jgi:hypothetical protein
MAEDGQNMFCRLFAHNQESVLEDIFHLLEPVDLKACRCVCKRWDDFIVEKLWRSNEGRRRMKGKLALRWRQQARSQELMTARSQVCLVLYRCNEALYILLWY